MSFAAPPKEILLKICHLLKFEKAALLEMQLTCKQWSQTTQEYYYTSVTIHNLSMEKLFLRTLASSNESIIHIIRVVNFRNSRQNGDSRV